MDFWSLVASQSVLRAILGFVLVLFLPGFIWTLVIFKQINIPERIALSFALSIALVTLSILVSNKLLGISITGINSVLIILVISMVPLAILLSQWLGRRRKGESEIA